MATREERKAETEKVKQADALLRDRDAVDFDRWCQLEPFHAKYQSASKTVLVYVRSQLEVEGSRVIAELVPEDYHRIQEECLA